MVVKAKPPQEDPETKARRERAESQAESRRERSLTDDVSAQTEEILRRFGRKSALAGSGSIGFIPNGNYGNTSTGFGSSSATSYSGLSGFANIGDLR